MNDIDLTEILKDCPRGFELYSSIYGTVTFEGIDYNDSDYQICVKTPTLTATFTKEGRYFFICGDSECCLFPSRKQRDWSKFKAPWCKKERFDPKTLEPFDRVLVRDNKLRYWVVQLFSHIIEGELNYPYLCVNNSYKYCIPYNEETKHLVGTTDKAPEFYRYWEG